MPTIESPETGGQARDIDIRAQHHQPDLIDQAAQILGKTRSDFMLETACHEAEDLLRDQHVFVVDAAAFAEFQAVLDAPPADNPRLRALLASEAPWET